MTRHDALQRTVAHETFVLERSYAAAPQRVFVAWADPEARKRWAVPSPDQAIEYLEADFRIGGRDISLCGGVGDLRFRVEARYLDIVPDRRIVFSEVVEAGDRRLSASLISVQVDTGAGGTRLTLTDQIAAFDGADMIAGSRAGLDAALDNLDRHLRSEQSEPDGG